MDSGLWDIRSAKTEAIPGQQIWKQVTTPPSPLSIF